MRQQQDDPLPFDVWLSELGKLAEASVLYSGEDEDLAIRRAFHLFMLAPPSIRALGDPGLEQTTVELLLERGEAEQAARLIAGERMHIVSERPAGLRATAIVSFPGGLSARGEGATPALALVRAWAELFRTAPRRELARLSAAR